MKDKVSYKVHQTLAFLSSTNLSQETQHQRGVPALASGANEWMSNPHRSAQKKSSSTIVTEVLQPMEITRTKQGLESSSSGVELTNLLKFERAFFKKECQIERSLFMNSFNEYNLN